MVPDQRDGRIEHKSLKRFVERLLVQIEFPDEVAVHVAESLVLADLRGHNSHGVRRIPTYVQTAKQEREGVYKLDVSARPAVDAEGQTHTVVDGQCTLGHTVGRRAVDIAVEKAGQNGVCVVGLQDSTHLGRVGEWSERAADAGYIFCAFVAVHGAHTVAPAGSAEPQLGTNPVSFGVPSFDALPYPIVFDSATSQVANGKTKEAAARGESLPEGWAVGADGNPYRDAARFQEGEGALLPLGGQVTGYKGFGLAIIAELLAAIAGDGKTTAQLDYLRGNDAMFLAIDPTLFTTREAIEARITALSEYIEETEYSANVSPGASAYGDRAYLPGEPEYRISQTRRKEGIPLPESDIKALYALAEEYGIENHVPAQFDEITSARS